MSQTQDASGRLSTIEGFTPIYAGKVRELHAVQPGTPAAEAAAAVGLAPEQAMLLVATDRISAYDFVLDTPITDKGEVLTRMSLWWFDQMADLAPHHVITAEAPAVPEHLVGRAVLVKRLTMLPVECVARAYLTGGGLAEYRASGTVSGVALPEGLVDGSELPEPVFTPSSKAPVGEHDEPITYEQVVAEIGEPLAERVRDLTVELLRRGNEIARARGVILADTKVEFGLEGLPEGAEPRDVTDADLTSGTVRLVLADEVLTPDSSRFWPADTWQPGQAQPSFDKQFVRDWLTSDASGWSKASGEQPPSLPADVVEATRGKYVEAYERLTGESFR